MAVNGRELITSYGQRSLVAKGREWTTMDQEVIRGHDSKDIVN